MEMTQMAEAVTFKDKGNVAIAFLDIHRIYVERYTRPQILLTILKESRGDAVWVADETDLGVVIPAISGGTIYCEPVSAEEKKDTIWAPFERVRVVRLKAKSV